MEIMYEMTVSIHSFTIWMLFAVIGTNVTMLMRARDIRSYTRGMRIFMPISVMTIFAVMFTGIVMMAAKHLEFTIENIVMILVSVAYMYVDLSRYSALKRADFHEEGVLQKYRREVFISFGLIFVIVGMMAVWMWQ